jgi:acid phosphatase family membrane protein YuiD
MLELIRSQAFLVAFLAGACAQLLKVLSFLIIEKKVNLRRFVQTDGSPNMHSAAFAALSTAVGLQAGFGSMVFAFAICLTAVIIVDTMNVKNATSRQAQAIIHITDRVLKRTTTHRLGRSQHSYTPMDVFTGVAVGVGVALAVC